MTKHDFIYALRCRLQDLPVPETEPYIEYYTEMIDDRIDEGMTEEEAVADIGTLDEIEHRIRIQYANHAPGNVRTDSFFKRIRHKLHLDRPLESWQVIVMALVLLVVLVPLSGTLFGIGFGGIGILIGLGAAVFGTIIGIYAGVIGLLVGSVGLIISGIVQLLQQQTGEGLFVLGGGLVLLGLCILAFWGVVILTKLVFKGIHNLIVWVKGLLKKGRNMI